MTHSGVGLEPQKRELEKRELEAVLASGIFDRAPNLENLLRYVCSKYFDGAANEIKEYSIAVDALGRPADFDQKRDSIVRVEAHRLRKRLRDFYETNGALHSLRIEIPSGQYAPRFVAHYAPPLETGIALSPRLESPAIVANPVIPPELDRAAPPALKPVKPWNTRAALVAAGIAVLLCTSAAAIYYAGPGGQPKGVLSLPAAIPAAPPGKSEVRLLAGMQSGNFTDRSGRVWQSDQYFEGGSVFDSGDHPVFGTREPRLYQTRREGNFSYEIPLAPGVYELRLYFAETLYGENNPAGGAETSRLFDVYINGKMALQNFDVIGEVGASTADIRAFKDITPAADGKLHLKFERDTNPAFLNAIEITPGVSGKIRPIRVVSRDHEYIDSQGRTWEPDRYGFGGQLVFRNKPTEAPGDPELFRGERFGNLRYVIPVPAGRYGVTLYFSEAWFGPGTPAGGGAGSRVFDILANGVVLRRGFDIFKEAHGDHKGITVVSHGLEPDAQGKLTISLHPVRNYACVSAIEVVDESDPADSRS